MTDDAATVPPLSDLLATARVVALPLVTRFRGIDVREALHAVGTRLFTVGLEAPAWDLGPIRDLVGWRDEVNTAGRSR